MKKFVLVLLPCFILFMAPAAAQCGKIKGNWWGCLTNDLLDQWVEAIHRKDVRLINSLGTSVCIFVKDREYSVLRTKFTVARIRVYIEEVNDHVDVWVDRMAIR